MIHYNGMIIMVREELEFDLTPSPELMTAAGIGSNFMGLGFALGEIIAKLKSEQLFDETIQ